MNLLSQAPTSRSDYRTKRPDKYDFCPSCNGPKRTKAELCRKCRKPPRPVITQPDDPAIRYIPLTKGQHAIVDTHLYDWLSQYSWQAWWHRHTQSYYAIGWVDHKAVRMHRFIVGLELNDPRAVDHENSGQTLDNRGSNLRIATNSQNAKNRRLNRNSKTGFKGVSAYKDKYRAIIYVDGKQIILGIRATAKEAHTDLYVPAALKYHGKFARLA